MKWIHFYDEIKQYLDNDEEILWSRKETNNLLGFIPFTIKVGICFITFITIGCISTSLVLGPNFGTLLIFSIGLVGIVWMIIISLKNYRKITAIQLPREQLKEYDFFYLITNKRYIRKDYFFHYKRDFSKYPENAFDQVGDTVFMNFDWIDIIIVDYVLKEINFKIKDFPEGRAFFLGFTDKDEMEKVMEIIQTVIPLEILETKVDYDDIILYIKYLRNEK